MPTAEAIACKTHLMKRAAVNLSRTFGLFSIRSKGTSTKYTAGLILSLKSDKSGRRYMTRLSKQAYIIKDVI